MDFIDIVIDKLTNSIESTATGESFDTDLLPLTQEELKNSNEKWIFDWKSEITKERLIYKLITKNNQKIIHGLISLSIKNGYIFIHLAESAPFNLNNDKKYLGVGGNLFAFACKISFQQGFEGTVSFTAKTGLLSHYKEKFGALQVGNSLHMVIQTNQSILLLQKYFPSTL